MGACFSPASRVDPEEPVAVQVAYTNTSFQGYAPLLTSTKQVTDSAAQTDTILPPVDSNRRLSLPDLHDFFKMSQVEKVQELASVTIDHLPSIGVIHEETEQDVEYFKDKISKMFGNIYFLDPTKFADDNLEKVTLCDCFAILSGENSVVKKCLELFQNLPGEYKKQLLGKPILILNEDANSAHLSFLSFIEMGLVIVPFIRNEQFKILKLFAFRRKQFANTFET